MARVPDSVPENHHILYKLANEIRALLKAAAADTSMLKQSCIETVGPKVHGEAIANATLAFRHLEDASMRLGKVLQALDGGVSVYDKATTVGAPENAGAGEAGGLLNTSP